MATLPKPKIVKNVSEIAEKIRFARKGDGSLGKVVFLIGAGCSISAGIPGASDIARNMVRIVAARFGYCDDKADSVEAYKSLIAQKSFVPFPTGHPESDPTDETIDWYKVYDEMFRRHFTAPDDVRELFATLVTDAKGAINWAHLCLGELVAQKYVSTVLTTNFDQLVLSGMVRAGVLPVVCDGIESLNRIDGAPRHAQLVELHGSCHTYLQRNAPEDVKAVREDAQAPAAIQKLLQHATAFVAIGYGGREEGVMDLLIQAVTVFRDKNLFWVNHSTNPDDISDKVGEFLSTSKHARLCLGQDADGFFLELCKSLKIGSPRAISQPLETVERVISEVRESKVTDPVIQAEIDAATDRTARLKAHDVKSQEHEIDPVLKKVSEIRETRLAGQHARAYELAKEALERLTKQGLKP